MLPALIVFFRRRRLAYEAFWSVSCLLGNEISKGARMPECRSYSFEQNGQVVRSRIHLTLETDDIAVEHAQKLIDREMVEVWQEDRLVAALSIAATAPEVSA
jgi:hypothetical protein